MALGAIALMFIYFQLTQPINKGPWRPEYEKLASVHLDNGLAVINNFRRARYDALGHPVKIDWSERNVDLSQLKEVWFGISVFASPNLAHTFLSFDFGDADPVVISVEARQRPDQSYSPVVGMLDRYHLIYVMADETDIIGVRSHPRKNAVYFQPLKIPQERAQKLFIDMTSKANSLIDKPEFYNTLTSNCTNSILKDTDLPTWRRYADWRILLSGYSDRIAYEYGVLDRAHSLEDLRTASHLNAEDFDAEDADFYTKIRKSFHDKIKR